LRGSYWTLVNKVEDKSTTLNYSKGASDTRHKKMVSSRNLQHTKIVVNKKLKEFVLNLIKNQSLKGIGGRTRIAYKQGLIETTISPTTLYSYIDNIHVEFINYSSLKRRKKHYYRMKYKGKRQNGISIDERPQSINNRTEFGH
jgi:IS30 family transposase